MSTSRSDENFPVASWLLPRRLRPAIHDFYDFARTADDVADDPDLSATEKRTRLDAMRSRADGFGDGAVHAHDLLAAFRQDVDQDRYADWDELMAYCRLSAAPVGRFLIGLTGGGARAWPSSDALCAALQILNHVQDCGDDYRALNRIYLPQDMMQKEGATESDLAASQASPALRRVLDAVLDRVDGLLVAAADVGLFMPPDRCLARETTGIHALAVALSAKLRRDDPLAGPVRLSKARALLTFLKGAFVTTPSSLEPAAGARQSSFYWAMRLMPKRKRDAMFAVYGFCRAVDDIADGDGDVAEKRARLGLWREDALAAFSGGAPNFTEVRALLGPIRDFDLDRGDVSDLLDGMTWDAEDTVRMADRRELEDYCDKVAGSVGHMAWRIFEADPLPGKRVASHLGRALQLTNILRDVAEDARRGRLYLPADLLAAHGIDAADAVAAVEHPALTTVMDTVAEWAEDHYVQAADAMVACGRCMRPARVMMAVYRRLLQRLRARRWVWPTAGRPRLSWAEKVYIVLRYGVL